MSDERQVYTVTELTRVIKATLEKAIGDVWIEGELSNVRRPTSGHYYFTLKDENAQISAVLFRGQQRALTFEPKDGIVARVLGEVTVYERYGNYQVIVRSMEEGGKGALQARFEELKERLRKEGLFDESRKQPIPALPRHIGVVTSPTGAAVRDILNVLARRFPNTHVVVAGVKVQGDEAAEEIASAIDLLNERGGLDVIIIGRGGGSLEDLWCFNEEIVARAVARSATPVISAVGHEIDFTISDFVADLRAPTPSAAAELVVGRKDAFEASLADRRGRLARALRQTALEARNRLLRVERSDVFREPRHLLRQHAQRLDEMELRMAHRLQAAGRQSREKLGQLVLRARHQRHAAVRDGQQRVGELERLLCRGVLVWRSGQEQDVRRLAAQLKALDPMAVLSRGYSLTRNGSGHIVRRVADVEAGERVWTSVGDGRFESEVTAKDDG